MVHTTREQQVANVWLADAITPTKAKAMLVESGNKVKVNGKVFKVYGKKVLALMHEALKASPKVKVTWSKGTGNSQEATLPNGIVIRFLLKSAKVFKDNELVQEIKYTQRTKAVAVKIINTVSSELGS